MRGVLLLALFGLAAASHVPGHIDSPTLIFGRTAIHPSFTKVARMALESGEEPVVVVYEPEHVAIVAERGINALTESMEDLHDILRFSTEEVTVCNAGEFGDVDACIEKPFTKILVPAHFSTLPTSRLVKDIADLLWVVLPEQASGVPAISNFEVIDKPVLVVRGIDEEIAPVPITVFSQEELAKSLPLTKSYLSYAEKPMLKSIALDKALPSESHIPLRLPFYVAKALPALPALNALHAHLVAEEPDMPLRMASLPTLSLSGLSGAPQSHFLTKSLYAKPLPLSRFAFEEPIVRSLHIDEQPEFLASKISGFENSVPTVAYIKAIPNVPFSLEQPIESRIYPIRRPSKKPKLAYIKAIPNVPFSLEQPIESRFYPIGRPSKKPKLAYIKAIPNVHFKLEEPSPSHPLLKSLLQVPITPIPVHANAPLHTTLLH